ncbi:MAG: response regulator [Candidatus Marinimicrobia bacterium]|nr:response regulator [Candidatus Neomarinimicrobiota bacterium]
MISTTVEPFKIGIVEDSAIISMTLKKLVEQYGYQVVGPFGNADEALTCFSSGPPDLILMDIVLNGSMDGIGLAREINRRIHIPIIYITGHSDETKLKRAKSTAPLGYIIKPFDPKQLQITLNMAFRKIETDKQLLRYQKRLEEMVNEKTYDLQREIERRKTVESSLVRQNEELVALNKELKLKNQQIMTKTLKLYQKDQLLKKLTKSLLEKRDKEKKVINPEIVKIIRDLQNHFEEHTLDEFEIRFSDIYHGFNERLLKNFPNLTPNEIRLCELIKLNFTTKDISNLTLRSVKSVEIARYRLRKKLGIGKYVNLATFLANF